MADYNLEDIIDYLLEYDEDSGTSDAIYELTRGDSSCLIEIKLDEFSHAEQTYGAKTFRLNKEFIETIQDDYYEGKSFYHCVSNITDRDSGEKFSLQVYYMNNEFLEASLERADQDLDDCCDDPQIVEILAKIDGEFNVLEGGQWTVQTPADLELGKKKKLKFKMCKNCRTIVN